MTNDATLTQIRAARPDRSTWLTANAGSGKTRVLTDRVARLLLEGVAPQNILCLTYTKAAAGEMQNRLFRMLGGWAMEDDDTLSKALQEKGIRGDVDLDDARRLFARAIETPGGLKIQTIHSFCAALLRRFPLEAGVSPRFVEMDDRTAEHLRSEVLDEMAGSQADVLYDLAKHLGGAELSKLVQHILQLADELKAPFPEADLRSYLQAPNEDQDTLMARLSGAEDTLKRAISALETGSATEVKAAVKLAPLRDKPLQPDDLPLLFGTFLFGATAANPFGSKAGKFPTQGTRKKHPELAMDLDDLMDVLESLRHDYLALQTLEQCRALYAFCAEFLPRVEARKAARGWLSFDDLIARSRALLSDRRVADWVLWRLDGGIDHILVDEAQDTSPDQWAVIQSLAAELAAGKGSHDDRVRTLFVVGDRKQSIYSFQGADPAEFDRIHAHFADQLSQSDHPLKTEALSHSFRSAPQILDLVDRVFAGSNSDGLEPVVTHQAFKTNLPGRVDVWDPIPEPEKDDIAIDWKDPRDRVQPQSARGQLAAQIAEQVARMVAFETISIDGEEPGSFRRRKVQPGDILILVRGRKDGLFDALLRSLKAQGLPVAGADRLKLQGEMAVRDLLAVLNFVALPSDDLSLATALRSPLFGWTEKQLYHLAQPRKGSLWAALNQHGGPARSILGDLMAQADYLRPYDLISRLLTQHNGRQNLLSRLGPECEEGIDALLSQALVYEQAQVPSLTGFLCWMATEDVEIKRQMGDAGNAVRVMTIHGSKGLEAPIVILPDTHQKRPAMRDILLKHGDLVLWPGLKADRPAMVQDLADHASYKSEMEARRLLYVAMTRAEKWLIIAAAGKTGTGQDSWHSMVTEALTGMQTSDLQLDQISGQRIEGDNWHELELVHPPSPEHTPDPAPIPGRIEPTASQPRPLAPSDLGGAKAMPEESTDPTEREKSLTRGTVLHRLLEHLPSMPQEQWHSAASQIIGQNSTLSGLSDTAIELLLDPELAWIFGPDSMAEVDLAACLPELSNRQILGAVDRLVVQGTNVTAVDYKSNRIVPKGPENVPEGLLRQMGAYRSALRQIFPNKTIKIAILWTQTHQLMELPDMLTDAALLRANPA